MSIALADQLYVLLTTRHTYTSPSLPSPLIFTTSGTWIDLPTQIFTQYNSEYIMYT